jgi:hypothetical protein
MTIRFFKLLRFTAQIKIFMSQMRGNWVKMQFCDGSKVYCSGERKIAGILLPI